MVTLPLVIVSLFNSKPKQETLHVLPGGLNFDFHSIIQLSSFVIC